MKLKSFAGSLYVLAWLVLTEFALIQSAYATPPSMVHVVYKGTIKLKTDEMSPVEMARKICNDMQKYKESGLYVPPFSLSGNPKDLETYTQDVYISPENGYHVTIRNSYKLINGHGNDQMCAYKIVPRQEKTILYYKQLIKYTFDSALPDGQQWLKSDLLGPRSGKLVAKTMTGLWGMRLHHVGGTNKIANLFCDNAEVTSDRANFNSTSCVWRAKKEENLTFLGYPLELVLKSKTTMGNGVLDESEAESANLRAAYAPEVFQAPKNVKSMTLESMSDVDNPSDPHCLAEKKKTGFNPCAGSAQAAKWCKAELQRTGVDPCKTHAHDNDDDAFEDEDDAQ